MYRQGFWVAFRVLKRRELAEEAVQVSAYKCSIVSEDVPDDDLKYFRQAVLHESLNKKKHENRPFNRIEDRYRTDIDMCENEPIIPDTKDPTSLDFSNFDADDIIHAKNSLRSLRRFITKKQRTSIDAWLKYETLEEASQKTKTNISTLKSHVRITIAKLKNISENGSIKETRGRKGEKDI